MKIAVPSETNQCMGSVRSGHFGHAPYFTIVTIDDGEVTDVCAVENIEHGDTGCGNIIEHVLGMGLDGIITVGMGRPPLTRFTQSGMTVYSERETPLVGDVIRLFLEGKVDEMNPDAVCDHH